MYVLMLAESTVGIADNWDASRGWSLFVLMSKLPTQLPTQLFTQVYFSDATVARRSKQVTGNTQY